jgi:hypothetical protein
MNKVMQAKQNQFSEQLSTTNVIQYSSSSEANISEISGSHFGVDEDSVA